MNSYSLISLTATFIAFCTAIFIYQRNPGSRINLLVSGLAVTVSFTAFTEFVYRLVENPADAYIWLKLSLIWPIIPAILLHISLIHTGRRLKPWMLAPIYGPAAVFALTGLSTNLLISGAMKTYYGWTYALPEPAVLFAAFAVWSIALALAAAFMVLVDYMRAEGYKRRESLYLFIGLFMPLIVSFITDFIVRDLLGIMFPELTQTMLSLGLLFIAYGVWRYEFPELSPAVAAERITEIMPNFLLITDLEGRINRWSRSIEEKLSYTELRGQYVWSIFEATERSMLREIVSSFSLAEMETRILSADGRALDVLLTASPIRGRLSEPIGFVFIATDVTIQRRATERLRESEMRFRGVADNISDGIAITDEEGKVIYWNRALEEITSIGREDAAGRSLDDICFDLVRESLGDDEFLIEGDRIVWRFSFHITEDLMAVIVRDVTETRRYEDSLRSALQERETLIREVHHRVKNNLQIISSLLNLQKPYIRDSEDIRIFEESQTRIKSMAMIHESLYQSESLSEINIKSYLSRLVTELLSTYGASGVVPELEVDEVGLDIEVAVPLALIVNELVTNSLKYALPGGRGQIRIGFRELDGIYLMEYRDTGPGLPDDFNSGGSDSLGMTLVRALVGQLEGELETFTDGGAVFRITFPSGDR